MLIVHKKKARDIFQIENKNEKYILLTIKKQFANLCLDPITLVHRILFDSNADLGGVFN